MTLAVVLLVASLAVVQAYPAPYTVYDNGHSASIDTSGQGQVRTLTYDGGFRDSEYYLETNPDGTQTLNQRGVYSVPDGHGGQKRVSFKADQGGFQASEPV